MTWSSGTLGAARTAGYTRPMGEASSHAKLQAAIANDRRRIAAGDRPVYHASRTTTRDGSTIDIMIEELPIIHTFVPDDARVLDGARGLVARTLGVDATSFDVVVGQP
jgi:hypothetical protein